MTRTSRSEPRTPYEVRIRTWLWIRQKIPRDFHQTIERLKQEDRDFRAAYDKLERLDSIATRDMPQHEKVRAMILEGRTLCRRVQAYATRELAGGGQDG